jgi:glycosyltransferase involved in cell wall biosynthesis
MRVAFYAPLKAPDHPIPSGDRRVAQLLCAALRMAGHETFIASRFRSYDRQGDRRRQMRLADLGGKLAERLLRHYREAPGAAPELWFTYHPYHKAPDWLGPVIAHTLGIPYVVAEASYAPKQAGGAWGIGHDVAADAIRWADAVIGLNPADRECILPLLQDPGRWILVKPFINAAYYGKFCNRNEGPTRLIVVGMMRYGDKLASYRLLGDALSRLLDLPWSLEVIGDGAARTEVKDALAAITRRVIWAGALDPAKIADRLAASDLYVWPAVNEAFGMALLEAQASGLPVVAGDVGGVSEIVVSQATGVLVPPSDAEAFSAAVRCLIVDGARRAALGKAARQRVETEHDISGAAHRLGAIVDAIRPACSLNAGSLAPP